MKRLSDCASNIEDFKVIYENFNGFGDETNKNHRESSVDEFGIYLKASCELLIKENSDVIKNLV